MKKILVFSFCLCFFIANGQPIYSTISQGNIWMFGDSIGIDFKSSPPHLFKSNSRYHDSSVGVLCDSLGHLKYFDNAQGTFTTDVFNKINQWVQTAINPVGNIHSLSWFLPFTGVPVTAYVVLYNNKSSVNHNLMNEVYYNRILDTLNQGLGAWDGAMNKGVSTFDSIRSYGASPVRHANGRDWWLVARRFNGDTMFVMLANPDTMMMVHRIKIGTNNAVYSLSPTGGANGGEMVFSKDGSKLLNVNGEGLIEVYDFDRCSGHISNAIQVEAPFRQNGVYRRSMYSSCLSPSGRFVYSPQLDFQSQIFDVVQYDLWAPNPSASRYVIYSIPFGSSFFVTLRLAPDNKIYLRPQYSINSPIVPIDSMALSVINFPDSSGSGCGFTLNGFNIGSGTRGTFLSQAPNYDLGPIDGSPCDTLGIDTRPADPDTTVKINTFLWPEELKLYPNPVQETLTLESDGMLNLQACLLYDMQGRVVLSERSIQSRTQWHWQVHSLPAGQYILEVYTDQGVFRKKLVKSGE